ncbi:MAG: hypothetical protein HY055_12465 [Magnetospirillum sp.]|nr:hypothetical protein [Magnetospirillum sp.]
MRRFLTAGTAATLGLLLLSACSSTGPAPVCNMSGIDAQRQLVEVPADGIFSSSPLKELPMNSVAITDETIANKVFVRAVNARRTATGTVEVVSQIINCTDYPLNAEARVQFYDKTKVASEPVSAWRRFNLPARTSNTYQELSIGTESVEYYMVEMRETR